MIEELDRLLKDAFLAGRLSNQNNEVSIESKKFIEVVKQKNITYKVLTQKEIPELEIFLKPKPFRKIIIELDKDSNFLQLEAASKAIEYQEQYLNNIPGKENAIVFRKNGAFNSVKNVWLIKVWHNEDKEIFVEVTK